MCLTPSQRGTQGWSQKYLSPTQEGLPSTPKKISELVAPKIHNFESQQKTQSISPPGGGVGVEGGDLEVAAVSLSGWGGGRRVELGKSEGGRGCKGSVGR